MQVDQRLERMGERMNGEDGKRKVGEKEGSLGM